MTATQLLSFRKSRKLTQKELGDLLGTSVQNISNWENGKHLIPDWVLKELYRAVNISLPIEDLYRLVEIAKQQERPLDQILGDAMRAYMATSGPPDQKAIHLKYSAEHELAKPEKIKEPSPDQE